MVKPFEIYPLYAAHLSACVVAILSPRHGYCISRAQLLRAKRKLGVPAWCTVFLRPNTVSNRLAVISYTSSETEVITCAS